MKKEDSNCCKGCKNSYNKKSYNGYRALTEQHWILLRVQKNIISNGLPPQRDTVTYKVTHEFYQADQKTKAADSKTEEIKQKEMQRQITASSYEAEGYKLDQWFNYNRSDKRYYSHTLNWVKLQPQPAHPYSTTDGNFI